MLDKPHFPTPDYAPDRWRNIARSYSQTDVARLSGSLPIHHTLAENGAKRLYEKLGFHVRRVLQLNVVARR